MNSYMWLALGVAIGLVCRPTPSWPSCLQSFGSRITNVHVSSDEDNGVSITIRSDLRQEIHWSVKPDEARGIADYLNDSADAIEWKRQDGEDL